MSKYSGTQWVYTPVVVIDQEPGHLEGIHTDAGTSYQRWRADKMGHLSLMLLRLVSPCGFHKNKSRRIHRPKLSSSRVSKCACTLEIPSLKLTRAYSKAWDKTLKPTKRDLCSKWPYQNRSLCVSSLNLPMIVSSAPPCSLRLSEDWNPSKDFQRIVNLISSPSPGFHGLHKCVHRIL